MVQKRFLAVDGQGIMVLLVRVPYGEGITPCEMDEQVRATL